MRVLILGVSGMAGHKMWQVFRDRFDTLGTVRGASREYSRFGIFEDARLIEGIDAMRFVSVERTLETVRPDVVINCVGIAKQSPMISDPLVSIRLNSLFPHELAQRCREPGIRVIHLSTDCVFSGSRGDHTEDDLPDPAGMYGRTKLLGELTEAGALTIRTSIIGRSLQSGRSLLDWFFMQRGQRVCGYSSAIFTGFTTRVLAEIIADIIQRYPELSGLWHVSSHPISKYDLLQLVNRRFGLGITIENDASVTINRSLNSDRFREATGFQPPTWEQMIDGLASDPTPYDKY